MAVFKVESEADTIKGHIEVTYLNKFLHKIAFNISMQLSGEQFDWIMLNIPQMESDFHLKFGKSPKLVITPLHEQELGTAEKIKWFCDMYMAHKGGLKYKVTARDSGLIKQITLTSGLLDFYFKSTHWLIKDRQCIPHLVRNYNEIRSFQQGRNVRPKPEHPEYYDPNYEKKLDATGLISYRRHLRDLGWEPVKHRVTGTIIDWKEPKKTAQV